MQYDAMQYIPIQYGAMQLNTLLTLPKLKAIQSNYKIIRPSKIRKTS